MRTLYIVWTDFNPRSREGSDRLAIPYRHALYSFQSTLPRRERHQYTPLDVREQHEFQSTLPRRERHFNGGWNYSDCSISIHAPAKGATPREIRGNRRNGHFNPRSREGSDDARMMQRGVKRVFQSTLPRRERRGCPCHFVDERVYFNPRSREGSDASCKQRRPRSAYFNPRSREGSDRLLTAFLTATRAFQSTLPRRERRGNTVRERSKPLFQSTLPRRERRWQVVFPGFGRYFNPRSREGSDLTTSLTPVARPVFQSTLPRRERR